MMARQTADNGQIANRVRCERCGKKGATLAEKLDECLRPVRLRLCSLCRTQGGFKAVMFDRSPPGTWGRVA
jgi:hypothetical protein